jgi:hypothetical protein
MPMKIMSGCHRAFNYMLPLVKIKSRRSFNMQAKR